MSFILESEIIQHQKVAEGCYSLACRAPEIARAASPGQFMHVRCGSGDDPLLPRPFGILGVDRSEGMVRILYQVVGRGTKLLSKAGVGDRINLLGPLGRGFAPPAHVRRVALIAGGLGIAPLCFLYQTLTDRGLQPVVFHGVRSAGYVSAAGLLPDAPGNPILMATDDGSLGYAGSVVDLFGEYSKREGFDFFAAAGPSPMLRALSEVARERGIRGEVSLEERMGCGIGACLCCNCRTREGKGWRYSRVCADGPVFPVEEVVWS